MIFGRLGLQQEIEIISREYWFKIVDMAQHNWAIVDKALPNKWITYFIHDGSGVFDRMKFSSRKETEQGLRRNGFALFDENKEAQEFITVPKPPFYGDEHPNGPIYSSGRFWK